MANSSATDFYQHLSGLRFRLCDICNFRFLTNANESYSFHLKPPSGDF
jgi:hypothetical protein